MSNSVEAGPAEEREPKGISPKSEKTCFGLDFFKLPQYGPIISGWYCR